MIFYGLVLWFNVINYKCYKERPLERKGCADSTLSWMLFVIFCNLYLIQHWIFISQYFKVSILFRVVITNQQNVGE